MGSQLSAVTAGDEVRSDYPAILTLTPPQVLCQKDSHSTLKKCREFSAERKMPGAPLDLKNVNLVLLNYLRLELLWNPSANSCPGNENSCLSGSIPSERGEVS